MRNVDCLSAQGTSTVIVGRFRSIHRSQTVVISPPNKSFERTRSAAGPGFAGSAARRAAQLMIR